MGVFIENPQLDKEKPLERFLKQCTLFLNAVDLEYHSILQHRCVCDEYFEHGHQSEVWSPYNLMLLLRMYRKLFDQMFPIIIQELADFLGWSKLRQAANHAVLSVFKQINQIAESRRSSDTVFASKGISTAQAKIKKSILNLRMLGISWLRGSAHVSTDNVEEIFNGCFEAINQLVGVFSPHLVSSDIESIAVFHSRL